MHFQPTIHTASTIRSDHSLAQRLTAFVNEGYRSIAVKYPLSWDPEVGDRFADADAIHAALGADGVFAVIYHPQNKTMPIACAAMTRWYRDSEGYAEPGESGWEIKTVTTQKDWMYRGLPGICVNALVQRALEEERGDASKVQIWMQVFEELNGAYWRRKCWVEVRGYQKPVGDWGSKEGYRLLVMLQEFKRE